MGYVRARIVPMEDLDVLVSPLMRKLVVNPESPDTPAPVRV